MEVLSNQEPSDTHENQVERSSEYGQEIHEIGNCICNARRLSPLLIKRPHTECLLVCTQIAQYYTSLINLQPIYNAHDARARIVYEDGHVEQRNQNNSRQIADGHGEQSTANF